MPTKIWNQDKGNERDFSETVNQINRTSSTESLSIAESFPCNKQQLQYYAYNTTNTSSRKQFQNSSYLSN